MMHVGLVSGNVDHESGARVVLSVAFAFALCYPVCLAWCDVSHVLALSRTRSNMNDASLLRLNNTALKFCCRAAEGQMYV
jgi:hypothetical protein